MKSLHFVLIAVSVGLIAIPVMAGDESRKSRIKPTTSIDSNGVFATEGEREIFIKQLTEIQESEKVCMNKIERSSWSVYQGRAGIERLTPQGLAILGRLYKQFLEDGSLVRHIGALIMLDLEDQNQELIIPQEKGGLGILNDSRIEILPIISSGRLNLVEYIDRFGSTTTVFDVTSNARYGMPAWAIEKIPHVFEFHFHATGSEEPEQHCAPSFGIDYSNGADTGDIANAMWRIEEFGESHHFLFIALSNRSFSTIYYGGQKDDDGKPVISVVALPIQRY